MANKEIKNLDEEGNRQEDLKRYFLLADAGKKLFESGSSDLEEKYKRILDEIFGLTEEELDEKITDKDRLARYNRFDWHQGQLPLDDIGPWPKMSGLDARLTTGNIEDTAGYIERVRSGDIVLNYADKQEEEERTNSLDSFLEKSRSIRDNLEFVYERFPIILLPGGEIREREYNIWARENDVPLCEIFKHDLDDGNSRAVSYALEGIDHAPCFYVRDPK